MSFEGEVSGSLVVIIVAGVMGAIVNGMEGTDGSCKRVFMETGVLATREVGLVIIESGSIVSVGDLELITICKPEVAGAEDVVGMKIGSLLYGWRGGRCRCCTSVTIKIASKKGSTLNDAMINDIDLCTVQCDGTYCLFLRWLCNWNSQR